MQILVTVSRKFTDKNGYHRSEESSKASAQSGSKPLFLLFCFPTWLPGRESSSSSSRIVGIDEGKSIRDTGGCGCCPWVDFMEAEGRTLLRGGVGEVVSDACEVAVSRSPKAPKKTWTVRPSSVPVSTPWDKSSVEQLNQLRLIVTNDSCCPTEDINGLSHVSNYMTLPRAGIAVSMPYLQAIEQNEWETEEKR